MSPEQYNLIEGPFSFIAVLASIGVGGWALTTWLRIKNGYPLDGARGQAVYPDRDDETIERVRNVP